MIWFLVRGRVRITIRVRVWVTFNVSVYHYGAIVAGANVVHSPAKIIGRFKKQKATCS